MKQAMQVVVMVAITLSTNVVGAWSVQMTVESFGVDCSLLQGWVVLWLVFLVSRMASDIDLNDVSREDVFAKFVTWMARKCFALVLIGLCVLWWF